MASVLRIPINNALMGGDYTVELSVGKGKGPLNLVLDTGSSMLVVDAAGYDPSTDPTATTTQLLQTANFMSGTFMASVVRTSVALSSGHDGSTVTLPGANLAVAYNCQPGTFGMADGIFGLAYAALDTARQMPADTWKTRYRADQLSLGKQVTLDPFISQAAAAGLVTAKFGFAVQRSMTSLALDEPATDPYNNGLLVMGGGMECTDLYSGPVTSVAVVHEQYYHTNLLAVRIGDQTINVPPVAPAGHVASNSIIDSGCCELKLDQGLYTKIIAMFHAINPEFATALGKYGPDAAEGCDQRQLDLSKWPSIAFVFQGSDGNAASIAVPPQNYWQFDSVEKRMATTVICGDNNVLGGQSNIGLPIFGGNYVVFDRTARSGQGVVSFAKTSPSPLDALVA